MSDEMFPEVPIRLGCEISLYSTEFVGFDRFTEEEINDFVMACFMNTVKREIANRLSQAESEGRHRNDLDGNSQVAHERS